MFGSHIFKDESKSFHLSKSEIDLFNLIERRNVKGVRKCLADQRTRNKININCFNGKGFTPLFVAIAEGTIMTGVEMITLLLEKNASLNLQNDDGLTALHIACQKPNHIAVERLLRCGADPNVRTNNGWTPLHYACQSSCLDSIMMLLNYNADANYQDKNGNTPLHRLTQFYVSLENFQCARTLLEHNADANIKNINGETPLLSAVQICVGNHHESNLAVICVIEVLLMFGADVNVQLLRWNGSICSGMHYTSEHYIRGVIGDTPLYTAVKNNCKNVVQIILNHNPDLKIFNKNKESVMELVTKGLCSNEIAACINEYLHPTRCQMYTYYRETWCHHLPDNNIKSISPIKKRKRKRKRMQYSERERKIKS